MAEKTYNVLFVCTGNSARSILAEGLMNDAGRGRFQRVLGGQPPHRHRQSRALETLRGAGAPAAGLRSKNWDEFAQADAPPMDFVFTVCDNAAGEICPVWPGQPMTAHWGCRTRPRSRAARKRSASPSGMPP